MSRHDETLAKSLSVLLTRIVRKQAQFSQEYVDKTLVMKDGKKFHVFRDLRVNSENCLDAHASVFIVRFKFSSFSRAINKRLSMMPTPFLIAKPGFHRKIWSMSNDGCFQGIYQWRTKEQAEDYPNSFIFKLMAKRSVQGTLGYEVIPGILLAEYCERILISDNQC